MSQVFSLDDKLTVERAGVRYDLSLPTFKDLNELRTKSNGVDPETQAAIYQEFLVKLGLPESVAESLPATTLVRLANALLSPDGLKKN